MWVSELDPGFAVGRAQRSDFQQRAAQLARRHAHTRAEASGRGNPVGPQPTVAPPSGGTGTSAKIK